MSLHYKEKLIDLWRCFVEGAYSAQSFGGAEYLGRLAAYSGTRNAGADIGCVRDLVRPTPGLKVLDYGCGLGALCAELSAAGCDVTGAEATPAILDAAKSRFPGIRFVGINDLDGEYDVVVSVHVLGHVPDARVTLGKIRALLRSGGRFVFCLPNPAYTFAMLPNNMVNDYLPDTTVVRCWSARRVRSELARAAFTDVRIEPFGELPKLLPFKAMRSRLVGTAVKC